MHLFHVYENPLDCNQYILLRLVERRLRHGDICPSKPYLQENAPSRAEVAELLDLKILIQFDMQ